MKSRGVTVLLGAVITVLLSFGVLSAPVPYVVLSPGPTVNTLGKEADKEVIQITGAQSYNSAGQLRLTTVKVAPETKLLPAIAGWFSDDEAVVPRELIYPPDQTEQQVEQQNAEDFQASQTSAETAALTELGYPIQVAVKTVAGDGAAYSLLKPGDVITSVDGKPVRTAPDLTDAIRAKPAGSSVTVGYTRAGQAAEAKITPKTVDGQQRIGVEIEQKQPHPFDLKFDLEDIGGPSAGLMFTLGIIDKLGADDLTGGKIIAGTGTIDDQGNVGPIGGIPQKLVGAKDAGAVAFLVPADNCEEAKKNAVDGLPLYKVGTLDEALKALNALKSGSTAPMC
ncbi:PDZ domain-containing protein [Asanoa sp. WMMD1127]|uniref:YlbL family protein n=1 Tax=Asanoa sp. WMMD1127 TaxID=3016107 RepID=UPI0024175C05|nr:PDZ domain-containing protein [Asanoa sp. WMMD1127]MDG4822938.1 PDZ domain-containing protein [Asanoa sp. WMMD1127]